MLLAALVLVSLGVGLTISIVGPTVSAIASRLRVHDADLGLVFTANFLAASVSTLAAGRVYDRYGSRVVLPPGLAMLAVGTLGEGLAPTFPVLVLMAVLSGLGIGILNVGANVVAAAAYPERRESALNLLNAAFGVGAFLAPLGASLSMGRLGGYAPAYFVVGAALALLVPPLLIALPARPTSDRDRPGPGVAPSMADGAGSRGALRYLLGSGSLRAYSVMGFLYLGVEIGFAGWIPVLVRLLAHLDEVAAASVGSVFWLCLALGGIPTAFLLQRGLAPSRLISAGAAGVMAAATALALWGGAAPVAVACCAAVGLSLSPILPLILAGAGRVASARSPGQAGGATGLVLVAAQVGAATLPPLQGFLLGLAPAAALAVTFGGGLLILALGSLTTRL